MDLDKLYSNAILDDIENTLGNQTFSIDIETVDLRWNSRIQIIGIAGTELTAHWYPYKEGLEVAATLLQNKDNRIVFQNASFDLSHLTREGISVNARIEDTMLMARVLDPLLPADLESIVRRCITSAYRQSLATIGLKIDFNWKTEHWVREKEARKYGRKLRWEDVGEYCKKDALYTLLLFPVLLSKIHRLGLYRSYRLDALMINLVINMRRRGVPVDANYCRKCIKILEHRRRKIQGIFGNINLNSNQQIINNVFSELGIEIKYYTDKGNPKLDKATMEKYAEANPQLRLITEWRHWKHSIDTYYRKIIFFSVRGVLHPSFWISQAKTGRFSSSDPNVQNMPKVTEEAEEVDRVRSCFLVRDGYTNWYFDYNQIELRLLAHYSVDPKLLKAFLRGDDVHELTMKQMRIKKSPQMSARRKAKILNYKIMYGMGVQGIATDIGETVDVARQLRNDYFNTYNHIEKLGERLKRMYQRDGYVKDIYGRRYYLEFPGEEYKLINHRIQGTAAGVMKHGMLKTAKFLDPPWIDMLMTIHDEIVIEIHDSVRDQIPIITGIQKSLFNGRFRVPIFVDVSWSRSNWGDVSEIDNYPDPEFATAIHKTAEELNERFLCTKGTDPRRF